MPEELRDGGQAPKIRNQWHAVDDPESRKRPTIRPVIAEGCPRSTCRFYVDAESDKACNSHYRSETFDQGVLSAIGDTDVTGDSKKSRSRPTGDHENQEQ